MLSAVDAIFVLFYASAQLATVADFADGRLVTATPSKRSARRQHCRRAPLIHISCLVAASAFFRAGARPHSDFHALVSTPSTAFVAPLPRALQAARRRRRITGPSISLVYARSMHALPGRALAPLALVAGLAASGSRTTRSFRHWVLSKPTSVPRALSAQLAAASRESLSSRFFSSS